MKQYQFRVFPTLFGKEVLCDLCLALPVLTVCIVIRLYAFLVVAVAFFGFFMFNRHKNLKNTMCRMTISEKGISSKYLSLSWGEIDSYTVCGAVTEIRRGISFKKRERMHSLTVLCFGDAKEDMRLSLQDKRKCLFLPVTQKTIAQLRYLAAGKSDTVDEILHHYRIDLTE